MAPDRTIASNNLDGSKKDKARITIALTANADGSEKLPPLFIGHFRKPRAFGKKSSQQLGFLYKFNKSAWMTSAIFQDWLLDLDKLYRMQQRKVLLLLDNAPTHIVGSLELTSLKIIFLPPNTTSKIQPLDAGIIAAFKKRYISYQFQNASDLYTLGTKGFSRFISYKEVAGHQQLGIVLAQRQFEIVGDMPRTYQIITAFFH